MISRNVIIQNKLGLHARASAKFVAIATTFSCHISVKRDDIEVNGKSIMGMMMLAASIGTAITLRADGERETEALEALVALVEQRFGEDG